mgnify:CR=1 FL=1
MKDNKSSISGIDANIIVLLGYLGGLFLSWITSINYFAWLFPLVIYIVEKKSEFVKEQMAQATVLYITTSMITFIFNLIWIIMFPKSYNVGLNLNNFSGSTLVVSTMNILSVTITVLISLIVIITSMKTWYYDNYKIPVISFFVPPFRDLLEKIINNRKNKPKQDMLENNNKENESKEDSINLEEIDVETDEKKEIKSINKKGKKKN